MMAPTTDLLAPVPSDELRVTGPMAVIVAPAEKVLPKVRPDTTLTMAFDDASVASTENM